MLDRSGTSCGGAVVVEQKVNREFWNSERRERGGSSPTGVDAKQGDVHMTWKERRWDAWVSNRRDENVSLWSCRSGASAR